MAHRGFDTSTDETTQHNILEACLEMVPELADFPIVHRWAGLRPSSPNGVPYIGKCLKWATSGQTLVILEMVCVWAQVLRNCSVSLCSVNRP